LKSFLLKYYKESKEPRYSFILILPLLIIYEYFAFKLNNSDVFGYRNAADILIKDIFNFFGLHGHLAVAFLILLGALIVYRYEENKKISFSILILMIFESLLYALFLEPVVENIKKILAVSEKVQFVSCLGAGIYEEFVFRLIAFSLVFIMLKKIFKSNEIALFFSSVISASAFSMFHYTGNLAEKFIADTFLYRFVAGLVLCFLFYFRGFGVAVYTHTFYDILIFYKLDIYILKIFRLK